MGAEGRLGETVVGRLREPEFVWGAAERGLLSGDRGVNRRRSMGGYLYCAVQARSGRSHARGSSRLLLLLLLEGQRACVMDLTAVGFAAVGAIYMVRRRARSKGRLLVALLGKLIYFL